VAALGGLMSLTGRVRRRPLLVLAGLVTIGSLSLAGHAADGAAPLVGIAADFLHVLAAAGWIGVLAIGTTLPNAPQLRRISPIAAGAVVVLVLSGIVQTIRNVGSLGALLTTAYGEIVDLKIALLAVLLVLALSARRILARGSFAIGARIRAELWILTAIVVCTAVLVESPLPRDAAPLHSAATSFRVRDVDVRVTATAIDDRRWNVRFDADGPLDEAGAAAEEDRRHVGPLAVPLTRSGPGSFYGTLTLPFAGEWHLLASARSGSFDEAHRTLDLPEIAP
jgi:copper transport protein